MSHPPREIFVAFPCQGPSDIILLCHDADDFIVEFLYAPSPDAGDLLAQAWDLILALILEITKNAGRLISG